MIDKILSHYRINAPLGRGGMGVVYLATDISLGRKVALKVLPPSEVNAEQRARFLLEARAASALAPDGPSQDLGHDRAELRLVVDEDDACHATCRPEKSRGLAGWSASARPS